MLFYCTVFALHKKNPQKLQSPEIYCRRQAKSGKEYCIDKYTVMCEISSFFAEYREVGNI